MIADSFLDTNVLVYAVGSDPIEKRKRELALELIDSVDFGLSVQVLQEFYTTITRKIESPIRPEVAFAYVDQFMNFPLVPVDKGIVTIGIQNSLVHQISYWDGAIIAAAERLNCRILYTENLNHGQRYGSVEVRNPFL